MEKLDDNSTISKSKLIKTCERGQNRMIPENSRRGIRLSLILGNANDIHDISDSDDGHVWFITNYINNVAKSCSIEDAEFFIKSLTAYGRKDLANIFIIHRQNKH